MLSVDRHELGSNTLRSATAQLRRSLTEANSLMTLAGFLVMACVAVGARLFADLTPAQISSPWLLGTGVRSNPVLLGSGLAFLAGLARFGTGSLFVRWTDLDRGRALQVFSATLLGMLAWRHIAGDFDYAYGQWWTLDRIGLFLFAELALWRPIALLPFIVEIRLVQSPLRTAFGIASGATLDDLPILALIAIVSTVLLHAAFGGRKTHVFINLVAAATAAKFFLSGWRKITDGWLSDNDLSNLPLNGYHQGWLGAGDGQLADTFSSFLATFRWPLLAATLVLEVGAVALLARRRSLMFALVGWSGFHLFVLLGFGFSFLEWAMVELGVFALLFGTTGAIWSRPAFRSVPVALTMALAVFGGFVFKPPSYAWFDGPMTYAYEFNAVDAAGNERVLVANDFAPHESAVAFGFLHLGPTAPLAAGYGALNRDRFDDLRSVSTWDQVASLESPIPVEDPRRDLAVANIERFLLASGNDSSLFDLIPDALTRYSTDRRGSNYERGVALVELSVTRVTTLRSGAEVPVRREDVVDFTVDGDEVTVRWVVPPG